MKKYDSSSWKKYDSIHALCCNMRATKRANCEETKQKSMQNWTNVSALPVRQTAKTAANINTS